GRAARGGRQAAVGARGRRGREAPAARAPLPRRVGLVRRRQGSHHVRQLPLIALLLLARGSPDAGAPVGHAPADAGGLFVRATPRADALVVRATLGPLPQIA